MLTTAFPAPSPTRERRCRVLTAIGNSSLARMRMVAAFCGEEAMPAGGVLAPLSALLKVAMMVSVVSENCSGRMFRLTDSMLLPAANNTRPVALSPPSARL